MSVYKKWFRREVERKDGWQGRRPEMSGVDPKAGRREHFRPRTMLGGFAANRSRKDFLYTLYYNKEEL